MRRVIFFYFSPNEQRARGGGGGGGRCQTFYFLFFPCSADHKRDWPPCKVVFFGLATSARNLRNNNNNNEEVLYLQPMIPPKRFAIFSPTGGWLEGLGVF